MSTQQQPPPSTRTWEWIVFSCLTTLLPANSTIMRPDPVLSAFQRMLLTLVLHVKTLLLPQLVLFEAATHFGSARLIRDRVNEAARRSRHAYLATHDEQPTTPDNPNAKAWVVRQWDLLCGNTVEVYTLECDDGTGNKRRVKFSKWTLAHGHFAVMGGFTLKPPLTEADENPSLLENQENVEPVSLKPVQLLALLDKNDPTKARFDLFDHVSDTQIKAVQESSSMGTIITIITRLLMFVYHCYKRKQSGLDLSPLEIITVGHVFLALVIEVFWWHRPAYLRPPGIDLDQEALCQALPGLRTELEDRRDAARGNNVVDAYTSAPSFNVLQWLPQQDNGIGLRIHANYRAVVVFGLAACHSALMLYLSWHTTFPTATEHQLWYFFLGYSFVLSIIITILAALDTAARHVSQRSPRMRELYGAVLDGTPDEEQRVGVAGAVRWAINEIFLLPAVILVFMCLAALAVIAGFNFRQPVGGSVYVAGSGDRMGQNFTFFGSVQ